MAVTTGAAVAGGAENAYKHTLSNHFAYRPQSQIKGECREQLHGKEPGRHAAYADVARVDAAECYKQHHEYEIGR